MTTRSGTFSHAEEFSDTVYLAPDATAYMTFDNTGGNAWQVDLEKYTEGRAATSFLKSFTGTGDTTGTFQNQSNHQIEVRLRCITIDDDPDSDTVDYTLANTTAATVSDTGVVKISHAAHAKAGTTAGWVVDAGNNLGTLATLPKAVTGGTLVVPLSGYKVGDRIIGCYLVGSVQATTAKTVTVDLDLRSLTAAATGATDASLTTLGTQVSRTADVILGISNTQATAIDHTVVDGESFYALVTATTANDDLCSIVLQSVVLQVIPA